ncbi:BA75_00361T0 [Komagataella pastoris]|uniref:BA75_00361T0 n=1 Tax=Komagataella pastoris TaxID=4922 RepID=A0A1B2J6U6_PICPA|nr:BA75_00361T0 [Komagataella pastoris]
MTTTRQSLITLFLFLGMVFSYQLKVIDSAQNSYNLATLEFDSKWKLHTSGQLDLPRDLYQICLDEDCFNYKRLSCPIAQDIKLTINKHNDIENVAFFDTTLKGLNLIVEQIRPAPIPKLPRKEKKITKFRSDNKLKLKEVIEEEEEVIVDNRSFIQKYWMYIVPALLLMLVSGNQNQ